LHSSLAALLQPFISAQALGNFAGAFPRGKGVIGLVMAGNIPGAGLHELIAALVTGWSVVVKAASREPLFFAGFRDVLWQVDPAVAARLSVVHWPRQQAGLTEAMRACCDRIAVFGDDETLANFGNEQTAGFGDRMSICVIDPARRCDEVAARAAWDISLFEQCGCLSPHHVFVIERERGQTRFFAAELAREMGLLATGALPPAERVPTDAVAVIRSEHERARWRAANGAQVELWAEPALRWSVMYDHDALSRRSPGYRLVFVSPFKDGPDLMRRIEPIAGRLEACALDATNVELRAVVEAAGATYICRPGEMQSPPLDWKHGGGAFHRLLRNS